MGDFKNLTAENLNTFKQHYISDDESLIWPTLEELITHSQTRNRDGSNVEYASSGELRKRFARVDSRTVITPCEKEIITVIIDVVTLFFGGREWIRHRTFKQLEEFFIHADLPLRDVSRCLNVLHFGNEVPYFTKAMAILRVLKFVFKGGVSAIIWGVWGIIVKNLSWKDLVLYGVEIGSEWFAFFATDGLASIAMIVQELGRGTWLVIDLTEMVKCLENDGSVSTPQSNKIAITDAVGLCVQAIDFPNPFPAGGYLTKSKKENPNFFMYGNTLLIQTNNTPPNKRFLGITGMGYMTSGANSLTINFQPVIANANETLDIFDGRNVLLNGKYQGRDPVGGLSTRTIKDYNFNIPQSFEKLNSQSNELYHFKVHKVNRVTSTVDEFVYDQDQILLQVVQPSNPTTNYLGIIYNQSYASGNRQGYYIGLTTNPQVWTVFKKPFNP